ncbi:hypothetical protein CF70_021255 [Cupriavidus sp. SK-3]|nr:hypothetical protein CF70_021255 [Cupriavidus sp. SK-3]
MALSHSMAIGSRLTASTCATLELADQLAAVHDRCLDDVEVQAQFAATAQAYSVWAVGTAKRAPG